MDQNEVTKHLSVGNTFCQATMHARIFCICCAKTWIMHYGYINLQYEKK